MQESSVLSSEFRSRSHQQFIQTERHLSPLIAEERADDAGVIISANVATQSLFAQAKATHEAAKYQDHPKDGQQCSGCQFFVVPNSCKVVEDPVAASGWCQLFAAKSA